MAAKIDLRKAHLHRPYGDILAVLSWIDEKRALFLIPHLRKGAPWFIVLEAAAFEWNYNDPAAVRLVAERSMKACEVLGIEQTPTNAHRIIDIVGDMLPELIEMPSAPLRELSRAAFGRMELRQDGQFVAGEDIRHEVGGATYG